MPVVSLEAKQLFFLFLPATKSRSPQLKSMFSYVRLSDGGTPRHEQTVDYGPEVKLKSSLSWDVEYSEPVGR